MDLNQLFESLQDQILSLYEQENTDLESQLTHWRLQRRSYAVQYYARKQGLKRLGLQPVPSLASSEAKGKEAVEMTLLISGLLQSPFANESWTLQDTSAELVLHTAPQRTFKKLPFMVEVWYDNDASNSFIYTNYKLIYVRDEQDNWYKTEGKVSYDGLYYEEANGDHAFFKLFADDAQLYGSTGFWSVRFNSHILSPPSSSSRPPPGSSSIIVLDSDEDEPVSTEAGDSIPGQTSNRPIKSPQPEEETERDRRRSSESPQTSGVRVRSGERQGQGKGQREPGSPPVKRAKADSSGGDRRRGARGGGTGGGRGRGGGSAPTAAEVGRGHISVAARGLTPLERLQAEARDPLIIIVEGPANCLKCWRYRISKQNDYFANCTSVFKWLRGTCSAYDSRILLSFKSDKQRHKFLTYVRIPKNCKYSFGSLDSL